MDNLCMTPGVQCSAMSLSPCSNEENVSLLSSLDRAKQWAAGLKRIKIKVAGLK